MIKAKRFLFYTPETHLSFGRSSDQVRSSANGMRLVIGCEKESCWNRAINHAGLFKINANLLSI